MKIEVQQVALPLVEPLNTSWGTVERREVAFVKLTNSDGHCGYGEAAPLHPYDRHTVSDCYQSLQRIAEISSAISSGPEMLAAANRVSKIPQAISAIDLALWDLAARANCSKVCELLSERKIPKPQIAVNATIATDNTELAAQKAAKATLDGYKTIKLKVGFQERGLDMRLVAAVREQVPSDCKLRIDAGGAWTVEEAARLIPTLAEFDLEYVEEPVSGIENFRLLAEKVTTPLALDETADVAGAILSCPAKFAVLKVGNSAGISGLLSKLALTKAAGKEPIIASTWDSPLGIAAAAQVAAAVGHPYAAGLATKTIFDLAELAKIELWDEFPLVTWANNLPIDRGSLTINSDCGLC